MGPNQGKHGAYHNDQLGWEHIAAAEIDALYTHHLAEDLAPDQKEVARIIRDNFIRGDQEGVMDAKETVYG